MKPVPIVQRQLVIAIPGFQNPEIPKSRDLKWFLNPEIPGLENGPGIAIPSDNPAAYTGTQYCCSITDNRDTHGDTKTNKTHKMTTTHRVVSKSLSYLLSPCTTESVAQPASRHSSL